MNTDLSQTTTSLILSHLYNVRYEARFSAMQKSIDSLLESVGNPIIKPNDPVVITRILRGGLNSSLDCSGQAISMAKHCEDLTFSDLVVIVGMSYFSWFDKDYTEKTMNAYLARRGRQKYTPSHIFPEITKSTYGLLLYREQAVELVMRITDMSKEEAQQLGRDFRKHLLEASEYKSTFMSLGNKKGFPEEELSAYWETLEHDAQMRIDQRFSLMVCWILYQIEYICTYHSDELEKVIKLFERTNDKDDYLSEIKELNGINLCNSL